MAINQKIQIQMIGTFKHVKSRSGLEKQFILILVQFLEIFFEIFEEEVSDYLS